MVIFNQYSDGIGQLWTQHFWMLFVGSCVLQKEHQIQKLKHTHNGVPSSIRDGTSCMAEQSSREKRTFLALVQPPSEPIFGPKLIDCLLPECVLFMVLRCLQGFARLKKQLLDVASSVSSYCPLFFTKDTSIEHIVFSEKVQPETKK